MKPYYDYQKKEIPLMRVGRLDFIHKNNPIKVNEDHYFPIFIAKNVDELRERKDT